MKEPKMEDYGWKDATPESDGQWTKEGGKEAYYKAMLKYAEYIDAKRKKEWLDNQENKQVSNSMVGKLYRHTNGNLYTVLMLTNLDASPESAEKYPIDVVYTGQNGKVWSRRLSDWERSFTLVN